MTGRCYFPDGDAFKNMEDHAFTLIVEGAPPPTTAIERYTEFPGVCVLLIVVIVVLHLKNNLLLLYWGVGGGSLGPRVKRSFTACLLHVSLVCSVLLGVARKLCWGVVKFITISIFLRLPLSLSANSESSPASTSKGIRTYNICTTIVVRADKKSLPRGEGGIFGV